VEGRAAVEDRISKSDYRWFRGTGKMKEQQDEVDAKVRRPNTLSKKLFDHSASWDLK